MGDPELKECVGMEMPFDVKNMACAGFKVMSES